MTQRCLSQDTRGAASAARTLALCTLLPALLLCSLSAPASAQDTFEEVTGRFMIDIPSGHVLTTPQPGEVYVFKTGVFAQDAGPNIILTFTEGGKNAAEAHAQSVTFLLGSVKNAKPAGTVNDLTVNGNSARLGIYKGTVQNAGRTVTLWAIAGGTVLGAGAAGFLGFYNEGQRPEWEAVLKETFYSLRNVGDAVAGAGNVRPAKP